MKKYPVLTPSEFFNKYRDVTGSDVRFVTKAYNHTDDTVALYPSEIEKDCYFQLKKFDEDHVPEDRRFIYFLPKNSVPDSALVDGERYKIRSSELKIFQDPYTDTTLLDQDDGLRSEEYKITKGLVIQVMKDMIKEYESRD